MNAAVNRKRQSGVVTLMGALFIIITIALMTLAANRMAGSNITDTATQNDAVEALFIAETGIEYASYVLANNVSSCDNLAATIVSTTSGRGSFDVTASSLNGTDCSITVEAGVSSVGADAPDASLRAIDAVLRLDAAAGWAVGDNGVVLQWDGTNWIAGESNTTEDLYSVHCESDSDCWAVGNNAEAIRWDGSSWTPISSGTNGFLRGVSCNSSSYCFSVGIRFVFALPPLQANIRFWNGGTWSSGGGSVGWDYYSDVSCPTSTCFATLGSGSVRQSSTAWDEVFSGSIALNGIDCPAANDCWAVGDLSGNDYYFVHYDGSGWASQTVAPPRNNVRRNLNAVSCANSNDCWAVGDEGSGRYVLVHWNGSNWIGSSTYLQSGQRATLNGVHCPTSNECWAVGEEQNGWNIINYDGTAWGYLGSAALNPGNLNDVFVFSGGGGSGGGVSLVRWQEQINN